jgi:hypothetical protein
VYAKKLKVNRGVDNVILFEFVNQDQKPVNISGSTITYRMMSTDGDEQLIAKDLETLSAAYGRAKVTLTSEELDLIEEQTATWSLERASGNLYEAVFTDAYSSGRGQVEIVDSVYPNFVESKLLEIPKPDDYGIKTESGDRRYTSMAYTANNTLTTFQFDFDNFSGNVKAQGSDTQIGPVWYDIGSQTVYINQTKRAFVNVEGKHNWVRFEINQYGVAATGSATVQNGAVTEISATGGSEYYGPGTPNVEISGLGTGATATATISGNVVTQISVTNGGQGYEATPTVEVNNGTITQITYR